MDERIHDVLDGRRARDGLDAEERDRLAALEATIAAVAGPLRTAPAPDLTARIMERVAGMRREASPVARAGTAARRALRWASAPRPLTIQWRPAYAVAMLGAVALFALRAPRDVAPASPADAQASAGVAPVPQVYVQFRVEARGASHVALAGSFTGWKPAYALRETAPGTWSILIPLEPGVHDYAFLVDGKEWMADPHALQVDDGFGGVNSRIALPPPPMGRKQS